jgi:hypothetical protein
MIKFIRLAVFSLILGVGAVVFGTMGSMGVKADVVAQTADSLHKTYLGGIIIGSILIILAAIFFILAIGKTK